MKIETLQLTIQGMSCAACANTIERTLNQPLPGLVAIGLRQLHHDLLKKNQELERDNTKLREVIESHQEECEKLKIANSKLREHFEKLENQDGIDTQVKSLSSYF